MKRYFLFVFAVVLFSCQNPDVVHEANVSVVESPEGYVEAPAVKADTGIQVAGATADSLHKPNLKEDELMVYAKEVVSGKRQASGDGMSQLCLKEMSGLDPEKRKLYFKVYLKMLNNLTDGLTEVPAHPVIKYVKTYPMEAMEHYKHMTDREKDQFETHLAYDFWVDGHGNSTIPAWINEIIIENPDCKPFEQDWLKLGYKMMDAFK